MRLSFAHAHHTIRRSLRRAAIFCLPLALLLTSLLATACSSGDKRGAAGESFAYLPAVGWYRDPETGEITKRWMGPLAERRVSEDGREETTIRPLFSMVDDRARMEREFLALWPLFQDSASYRDYGPEDDRTRKYRIWLLPFFYYNEFSPIPGETDIDYFAPFPIIIGGSSTRDGDHFAVIPLGGTLKGYLGQDEISFVAAPLYVKAREGEATTWHFPWPLIRYGEGPRYLTHAVLPLYSYSHQLSDYKRYSVLWPLVSWGEVQLGSRWPRQYWMVLPFASRSWTAGSNSWSFVPPFFNYMTIERSNTTLIDAPWPFIRVANGDNYSEFRILPIYRRITLGDDVETNIAWPFIWHFDDREPGWRESRTWVLPFWFSRDRVYDAAADGTQLRDGGWDLWPLARSRSEVDGRWRFQFPAPLPPLGERFDRIYGSVFRWVSLESEPGRHNTEIFWGLVKHREDETGHNFSVFPFYWNESVKAPELPAPSTDSSTTPSSSSPSSSSASTPSTTPSSSSPAAAESPTDSATETKEWRILGGLVGRKKSPGKTTLRLLWFITFDV